MRHHPQLRRGRADLELLDNAVRQAGQQDGTLLVLDPLGHALSRLWCLLEVWRTAKAVGSHALLILSTQGLHGPSLRQAWANLLVAASAATTRPEDRELILPMLPPSFSQDIHRALISSASSGFLAAVQRAKRDSDHVVERGEH